MKTEEYFTTVIAAVYDVQEWARHIGYAAMSKFTSEDVRTGTSTVHHRIRSPAPRMKSSQHCTLRTDAASHRDATSTIASDSRSLELAGPPPHSQALRVRVESGVGFARSTGFPHRQFIRAIWANPTLRRRGRHLHAIDPKLWQFRNKSARRLVIVAWDTEESIVFNTATKAEKPVLVYRFDAHDLNRAFQLKL